MSGALMDVGCAKRETIESGRAEAARVTGPHFNTSLTVFAGLARWVRSGCWNREGVSRVRSERRWARVEPRFRCEC
jgi:hypothetical protein